MDERAFDRVARKLASANRRTVFGALVAGALSGAVSTVKAKPGRRPRKGKRRRDQVAGQAIDCLSLESGANVSGCDYSGQDRSGAVLSGATMVGTIFRDAILIETEFRGGTLRRAVFNGADLAGANLASSVLERADFRAANLCGANLRSSNVRQAAFQNADLTRATFRSSAGCNTAGFSAGTTFCGTEMCDGTVRNDDCPDGRDIAGICCTDAQCPSGQVCIDRSCVPPCRCNRGETCNGGVCRCGNGPGCPEGQACNEFGECVDPSCCGGNVTCGGYSNVDGLCCRSGRAAFCCCDSRPGAGDGFLRCIDFFGAIPSCPSGVFALAGTSASPNEDGVCARGGDVPPTECPS